MLKFNIGDKVIPTFDAWEKYRTNPLNKEELPKDPQIFTVKRYTWSGEYVNDSTVNVVYMCCSLIDKSDVWFDEEDLLKV